MRTTFALHIAGLAAGAIAAPALDSLFSPSQIAFGGLADVSLRPSMTALSTMDATWRHDQEFEVVATEALPEHSLRVKKHKTKEHFCDPNSSGYLDVSDNRHLFYCRTSPLTSPLLLWLNGGPGCSSSTGLLFELGPCRVVNNGTSTELNVNSWNNKANVIFLDQPIAVGYSYAEGGESVNNTPDAAKDVYAFLQLFYQAFPQYRKVPFHLAAESYGGHYAPNIAAYIHQQNLAIKESSAMAPIPHRHIPLASIAIGNGLTDPKTQFATVPEYACAPSKTAIFDEQTCDTIRSKVATCDRLQGFCYSNPSRLACTPAALYCWSNVVGPIQSSGLNPYDIRRACDRAEDKDGPLCYKEMEWIDYYLNRPEVKKALGVPPKLGFTGCNMEVNRAFMLQGDGMHNSAALLPPLIDAGIRVLIYAGEYDFMCEWIGNRDWFLSLPGHRYSNEISKASVKSWTTIAEHKHAGDVFSAGDGDYTFVKFFGAGHMVPADQPVAAQDMIERWIAGIPLADN